MADETARQQEQGLVLRLLKRWRGVAGERLMPTLADLGRLADRIRDYPGRRWRGSDRAGRRLSRGGGDTLLGHAIAYRAQVIERGVPASVSGQFVAKHGRTVRSLLLPLRGSGITALHGCVNGRAVVLDQHEMRL